MKTPSELYRECVAGNRHLVIDLDNGGQLIESQDRVYVVDFRGDVPRLVRSGIYVRTDPTLPGANKTWQDKDLVVFKWDGDEITSRHPASGDAVGMTIVDDRLVLTLKSLEGLEGLIDGRLGRQSDAHPLDLPRASSVK